MALEYQAGNSLDDRTLLKNRPIDDMLAIGTVTADSARIWMRVSQPGNYTLSWIRIPDGVSASGRIAISDRASDYTGCFDITQGLVANTRYRLSLHHDSRPLATGSFMTAPRDRTDVPRHFSVALMSCHQPFDADGRVSASTEPMLEAVNQVFQEHRVRAVVMGGDQLYSDYPANASLLDPAHFRQVAPAGREDLLDCTAQEVRELFHQRYRHFWNVCGWRELLANYPCYPILDDHEIVDNWGSAEEHQEPRWQAFRHGAFAAYADYQGTRVCAEHAEPPASFDYTVELGDAAIYVMDLRSNRRAGRDSRLVSQQQLDSLQRFLRSSRDSSVVFLVLSVPLLHLPRRLARMVARVTPDGEDFSDRWSADGHCSDRDAVLRLLHEHQRRAPGQRVVLLSGDIHIGCLHRVHWEDGVPGFFQFISSGVTHDAGALVRGVSRAAMSARRRISVATDAGGELRGRMTLVRGEPGASSNPCGSLNVGIVELMRPTPTAPPAMRFLLYSHQGSQPRCLYRSPVIETAAGGRAAGVVRAAVRPNR